MGNFSRYNVMNGVVCFNGKPLPMSAAALKVSPTGFNWGYGGSGPYALAHSILSHQFGHKIADQYAMQFKWDVIAKLDSPHGFMLWSRDIRQWVKTQQGAEGE